jgi:capsular exopolysaccharide synthesis family protein
VADNVIQKLHLDHDGEFNKPGATKKDLSPDQVRDALIDRVVKRLKVKRTGQTLLINISFSSESPTKAARIANAFAEAFIAHDLQDKLSGSRDANVLLNAQISDMRQKVVSAEAELEAYKSAHGLLSSNAQSDTVAMQNMTMINHEYDQARVDEAQARAKFLSAQKSFQSAERGDTVSDALSSQTVVELRNKRAEMASKAADLESKYGPMHPDLKNAKAAVRELDSQIDGELKRILSNLQSQAEIAKSRVDAARESVLRAQSELSAGASASVKGNELQRNADAARKLYEQVLARVQETSAQQAVSQSDSHVDTPATPPSEPSSPNKPLNLVLGLILGLGVGAAAAYLRESWNAQFTDLQDVEELLGLPYLGSIPTLLSSIAKPDTRVPADAVCVHPLSSFAEAFRGLATNLVHGQQDGNPVKVIGITSAIPGEGKTVTTVSLARVQAMSGLKVILLDCDLRRRTANAMMGAKVTAGLIEVIEGTASFEDVMQIDDKSGAHFVPLREDSHLAKAPFANPRFDALLEDLRNRYDLVILDTPPLLPVVDTRLLAQKVDALAILVKWRSTPLGAVRTAVHHLDSVNAPIAGVVLSQVNMKVQAYSGYSYGSYYNKDFQKYYHKA